MHAPYSIIHAHVLDKKKYIGSNKMYATRVKFDKKKKHFSNLHGGEKKIEDKVEVEVEVEEDEEIDEELKAKLEDKI